MNKSFLGLVCLLVSLFIEKNVNAKANEYLRIGMEAAYSPFNWTQDTDVNGAIPIEGTNQYANGYDVQIAKKISEKLKKQPIIVKTSWNGLTPALTSGKIDMIIAGMSPTTERKKEIAFSDNYYTSEPVIVVKKGGKFENAQSLTDFTGAKITSQQGAYLYDLISQLPNVKKETSMGDFPQMRQALESGSIDGYISERPEALTAEIANSNFKMIQLKKGFNVNQEFSSVAIGMRKGDDRITQINEILTDFTLKDQINLMNEMITHQPIQDTSKNKQSNCSFFSQVVTILINNWKQFLRGAGIALLISTIGTILGLCIGLLVSVFRTTPLSQKPLIFGLQKLISWLLNIYIEVFRGTPMIVQSMVIYYGTAQAFGISINRTIAAIVIVSINTGAYMSEIVRGGILSIEQGQFEAATALGMTHGQTMRKIILPQVIRNILPATGNEFVINIKDTSVLNVISVVELYFSGNTVATQTFQYFQTFTIIAVIYFILTFTVTQILRFIEKYIDTDTYTTRSNQSHLEEFHS